MSFFRGVVKGAAKSLDKNITEQLAFLKSEASSVAKIRANRRIREQEKYLDQEAEMAKVIKDLSKKAGGYKEVQFVLDKYGVDEGTSVINQLYDNQKNYGISVKDELRVEQADPSIKISALDIARKYTPKIKTLPKGDFSNLGSGITRMLGVNATDEVNRQTSSLLEAAGVDDFERVDLPIALQGSTLPEWQIYKNSDPKKERVRLVRIAHNKGQEFERTGDPEAKKQQELALSMAEIEESFLVSDNKPLTSNEVNKAITVSGNFMRTIFGAKGVGEFVVRPYGDSYLQKESTSTAQSTIITEINSKIVSFTNDASKLGLDAATIRNAITKGLTSYPPVLPVLTTSDGSLSFDNPDPLMSIKTYSTLFPTNMHVQQNVVDKKNINKDLKNQGKLSIVEELQLAWNDSFVNDMNKKSTLQNKVFTQAIKLGLKNPEDGTVFTNSNDLEKYFNKNRQ